MKHTLRLILLFIAIAFAATVKAETTDGSVMASEVSESVVKPATGQAVTPLSASIVDPEAYKATSAWGVSRMYKGLAWTSFGVGMASLTGSVIWTIGGFANDKFGPNDRAGISILAVAGATFLLSSIPLFVLSNRYKNKAKSSVALALTTTTITEPMAGNFVGRLALSFSLNF